MELKSQFHFKCTDIFRANYKKNIFTIWEENKTENHIP